MITHLIEYQFVCPGERRIYQQSHAIDDSEIELSLSDLYDHVRAVQEAAGYEPGCIEILQVAKIEFNENN